jgi:hypothetical protein
MMIAQRYCGFWCMLLVSCQRGRMVACTIAAIAAVKHSEPEMAGGRLTADA